MEQEQSEFVIVFFFAKSKMSAGDVFIKLINDRNKSTREIFVNNTFIKRDEAENVETYNLNRKDMDDIKDSNRIVEIELRRDSVDSSKQCFITKIKVINLVSEKIFIFPVYRYIKPEGSYKILSLDTVLPQDASAGKQAEYTYLRTMYKLEETLNKEYEKELVPGCFPNNKTPYLDTSLPQDLPKDKEENRKMRLERKRKMYELDQKFTDGPCQVKKMPKEESFPIHITLKIGFMTAVEYAAKWFIEKLGNKNETLEDLIRNIYGIVFRKPEHTSDWMEDDHFAMQRLAGVNHSVIELVTAIPSKFPVTDALLKPHLQGLKITQAIAQKRLFICDLQILEGLPVQENKQLCAPIALFFVNDSKKLKPVAIQLNQRPGTNNPIFTPACPKWTWILVKMWFNNADAAYHQALTHLGFTHLLMEGFALSTNRQLSEDHPVYKILAPHFIYLHAINRLALTKLLIKDGWVDKTSSYGSSGMCKLISKGLKVWRVDQHGLLPNDLKRRGVEDPKVLPDYHFRDDASILYDSISEYVNTYINLYYKDNETLKADYEIQNFAKELVSERNSSNGGIGILGLPGNGSLTTLDQLKDIVTCVIYISSVGHAAANFPQYDEYGFPPNYPLMLRGNPPKDPEYVATEDDVMHALPDINTVLDTLIITQILSTKNSNSLGKFEFEYINDPNAKPIEKSFQDKLKEISQIIKTRNKTRSPKYQYLNPEEIPNAISI